MRKILEGLMEDTVAYHTVLEEAKLKHPQTKGECDYHIAVSSQQEQIYNGKYSEFLLTHL